MGGLGDAFTGAWGLNVPFFVECLSNAVNRIFPWCSVKKRRICFRIVSSKGVPIIG
jgi:hypothetical protein